MLDSNLQNPGKLISVITVVYNNVRHVRRAIQSVLSQNYTNLEYIVIDGNSSDGTQAILEEFRSRISLLLIEPDNGLYDALNKGIVRSRGDLIGFLHSDDYFANNNVIREIAQRSERDEADVVYGDLDYIRNDSNNSILRHWRAGIFSKRKLKYGWMPPHPSFYASGDIYKQIGGFNLDYKIASDYDCMMRILLQDISVSYIPKVFVKMRVGGKSNKEIKNIFIKSYEDYLVMKKHKIGGVLTLISKNFSKFEQFIIK